MKLLYCSECAATLTKQNDTVYVCDNGHMSWNNPRATVAVIFLKDGQALFSKRGIEPNKGKYDFPGGFLEYNEDAYDACVREIQEETGLNLNKTALQLLTVYSGQYLPNLSVVDLVFVVTEWSGTFTAQDDSESLEWKPLSFISDPEFNPPYEGLEAKLAEFIKHNNLK